MNKEPELIRDLGMVYATPSSKQKRRHGVYRCPSCLNEFTTATHNIKTRHSTKCVSCGRSAAGKKKIIHGDSSRANGKTRMYRIYTDMLNRCNNKNNSHYSEYGGRGIFVCNEWAGSYISFKTWAISNGYDENLTIDREDNDGGYSPKNCRWVGRYVQSANRRRMRSNKSGYVGVCRRSDSGKWSSYLAVDGEIVRLGQAFGTAHDAALVREEYIIKNDLPHTRNFSL